MRITDFVKIDLCVDFECDGETPERLQGQQFAGKKLGNFISRIILETLEERGDELCELISDEYEYLVDRYTIHLD